MIRARGRVGSSIVLGLVGAAATLGGWWLYLAAGIVATACALVTIAQPLYGILGFVVLAPELSPYAQIPLPAGVPDLTFARAAISLVAGSVLLAVIFGLKRLAQPVAVEKAMAAFVGLVYLDLYVRSPSFESDALIVFDELATPFLFFYFTRMLFRTSEDARKFLGAMLLTGLVLSGHGIYQYAIFGSIGNANDQGLDERTDTGHLEKGRAAGPFVNSVEYGGVVSLAFLAGVLLFIHGSSALQRLALMPVVGLLAIAATLSLTRSVWLGLLVAILTIAALDRRWRTAILATLVAGSLLGAVAIELLPEDDSRLEDRALSTEPMYIRIVMYRAALAMVADRPVFGYGRGESRFVAGRQQYLTSVGTIPADFGNMAGPPHNVYLYTLLQWGTVGLTLYLTIFYLLLRSGLTTRREGGGELRADFAVVFVAATAMYMVQSMFADVVAFTFFTNVFFIGAGVFAGLTSSHEHLVVDVSSA
jgi:O-antigen ligase